MKFEIRENQIGFAGGEIISPETNMSESQFSEFLKFTEKEWTLDHHEQSSGIFPFSISEEKELIFYAGSFSPWHKGHGACVRNAPKDKPVIIMPDHNPWKEVRTSGLWEDFSLIWKDLIKIKEEEPTRKLSLFTGFLPLKKPNPTYTWMSYYREAWPEKKVWLLMGEDTFMSLHKWYKAGELLGLIEGVYVCPRGESKEEVERQKTELTEMSHGAFKVVFLQAHRYEHFSSTFARENK